MRKTRRTNKKQDTRMNKICAIVMALIGILSASIDGDGTGAVFIMFFAIPLFFAKENWIV